MKMDCSFVKMPIKRSISTDHANNCGKTSPFIQHGHARVSLLCPCSYIIVTVAQSAGQKPPVVVSGRVQELGDVT